MTLRDKLLLDIQQSMRTHDVVRRNTLRLLRAAITNAEIEADNLLDEAKEQEILKREAKRRRESIEEYKRLERQDKADEAKLELAIIEEFLPNQMGKDEIETLVRQTISEMNVNSISDAGEVLKRIIPQIKNRADGHLILSIVKEFLSENKIT